MNHRPPRPTLFPYTTLFRSRVRARDLRLAGQLAKPAARRRGRAHFLHEIPSVQRAAPRRGVLQHALASNILKDYIRSEEHTSELQSLTNLVCRLLLEKKNKK